MTKYFFALIASFALVCFACKTNAQFSKQDYARADSVMNLAELVYNQVDRVNWIDSTSVFWYGMKTRDGMNATNIWEYWAEGVQNWFNVNAEVEKTDGKHNWVNTRDDMKKYDPDLYEIIGRYFPEFESSPSCHAATNLYTH